MERIKLPTRKIEREAQEAIERLQRQCFVELEAVQQFHTWLDDKRHCRQACRVIGDSRTGKTLACDAYRLKYAAQPPSGDAPILPVIYWHATTETGQRELFMGLLEHLKYRVTNGTISDLRERVYRLLRPCQVEMIILDEAHRFRPKTFSEIRDIFDLLDISVVLVGTDRLEAVVRRDEQVHNRFMACHRNSPRNPAVLGQGGIGAGALSSAQLTSGFTVYILNCEMCKEPLNTASIRLHSKKTCSGGRLAVSAWFTTERWQLGQKPGISVKNE